MSPVRPPLPPPRGNSAVRASSPSNINANHCSHSINMEEKSAIHLWSLSHEFRWRRKKKKKTEKMTSAFELFLLFFFNNNNKKSGGV